MTPAVKADKNAATGRAMVRIGSSSAQERAMESTPDSGVDMRKAVVAPLFADLLPQLDGLLKEIGVFLAQN